MPQRTGECNWTGLDVVYDFDCVVGQNFLFYLVSVLRYGWFSG